MEYLLLIYKDNEALPVEGTPDHEECLDTHRDLTKELRSHERFIGSNALEPSSTGATVRVRHRKIDVTDGPFAETREQLAGYYLVECDSMQEAVDIAARLPEAAAGAVEVRPVLKLHAYP